MAATTAIALFFTRLRPCADNILRYILIITMDFHGAVFPYGAVWFGAVLLHRTAPYDFVYNKTVPRRTVGLSKTKIRTAPFDSRKYKHHEKALGSQKSSSLLRCGYGAVRCGSVLTEPHRTCTVRKSETKFTPHRTIPYNCQLLQPAPHRSVGFWKLKTASRFGATP